MSPVVAAIVAGALSGAATAALLSSWGAHPPSLGPSIAQAATQDSQAPRYEYQIATVDMLNRTVKVGDQVEKFSITQSFDQMLTATAQKGGWRLVDVYTIGAFGPFFVMERQAP